MQVHTNGHVTHVMTFHHIVMIVTSCYKHWYLWA